MTLTKGQQEFIGTTFDTPKGGVLTVTGVSDGVTSKGKWDKKFILEGSICSKDEELWPEGSIKSSKGVLKRSTSCGCTKAMWTREQYEIRVKREAFKRNYTFLGFCEWKGAHTKLKLHNTVTGNTWESTNISRFFGGQG